MQAQNGPDHSPFYEWLLELHDHLAAHGGRLMWKSICARAAELGKCDASGNPPTPKRASKTWMAVRQAKAKAAAMRQARAHSETRYDPQPQPVEPTKRIAPTD